MIQINGEITDETLSELEAQGYVISGHEESDVYGTVVFATVTESDLEDFSEEIITEQSEHDYKTEILTEIANEAIPSLAGSEGLENLVDDQIIFDEQKEELGITGPIILGSTEEKFAENEWVYLILIINIEELQNIEQHMDDLSSELESDIKDISVGWSSIDANVTKEGFEILKEKEYIMVIDSR